MYTYYICMYVRGNSKRELFNQLMKYAFAEILAGPVHQQTALSTTTLIINRSQYQLVCCYLLLQIVTTVLLARSPNSSLNIYRNSTVFLRGYGWFLVCVRSVVWCIITDKRIVTVYYGAARLMRLIHDNVDKSFATILVIISIWVCLLNFVVALTVMAAYA